MKFQTCCNYSMQMQYDCCCRITDLLLLQSRMYASLRSAKKKKTTERTNFQVDKLIRDAVTTEICNLNKVLNGFKTTKRIFTFIYIFLNAELLVVTEPDNFSFRRNSSGHYNGRPPVFLLRAGGRADGRACGHTGGWASRRPGCAGERTVGRADGSPTY